MNSPDIEQILKRIKARWPDVNDEQILTMRKCFADSFYAAIDVSEELALMEMSELIFHFSVLVDRVKKRKPRPPVDPRPRYAQGQSWAITPAQREYNQRVTEFIESLSEDELNTRRAEAFAPIDPNAAATMLKLNPRKSIGVMKTIYEHAKKASVTT